MRYLFLLFVLGLVVLAFYILYRAIMSSTLFNRIAPQDDISEQVEEMAERAQHEKAVKKAAEDKLRQDREKLEAHFPTKPKF